MLRRLLIKCGWSAAELVFWGSDPVEIISFILSVKANKYVKCIECESYGGLIRYMDFKFEGVSLMTYIAYGNRGARLGIFESFDGIACFVDKRSDEALEESEADLRNLLSDPTILQQPMVILVRTENASGYASDSELLSGFQLGDVIKEREGRVAVFAYSLSPTQFVGCAEAVHWLLDRI